VKGARGEHAQEPPSETATIDARGGTVCVGIVIPARRGRPRRDRWCVASWVSWRCAGCRRGRILRRWRAILRVRVRADRGCCQNHQHHGGPRDHRFFTSPSMRSALPASGSGSGADEQRRRTGSLERPVPISARPLQRLRCWSLILFQFPAVYEPCPVGILWSRCGERIALNRRGGSCARQ
jgi:hypothetical protein